MPQPTRYLPVNWTDGMKINKSHFINERNATIYQLLQGIQSMQNIYNYGLLPADTGSAGNELFVMVDNQQQVQLRLQKCRAITFGGHVINLDETGTLSTYTFNTLVPELKVPLESLNGKSIEYFIVLVINPYDRIPYGNADILEIPPRMPYVVPSCKLHLIPVNETNTNMLGSYHLPVGKLKIMDKKVILDEDYIPPCSCIKSHEALLQLHAGIEQFLGKMELYSLQIIQKIIQKKQQNPLADITFKLCEQVSFFTALNISSFKLINLYQPPVCMINTISSFARLLKNTLDFYTGSGKEDFINYCMEQWTNAGQSNLESDIILVANHSYTHLDINESFIKVSRFIETFTYLFSKLLSLEYIGKRKEGLYVSSSIVTDNVIKEQIITAEPTVIPKRRTSFLAE
jgi:hypothetical protein